MVPLVVIVIYAYSGTSNGCWILLKVVVPLMVVVFAYGGTSDGYIFDSQDGDFCCCGGHYALMQSLVPPQKPPFIYMTE